MHIAETCERQVPGLVSIIIPTFNYARYLPDAINSVLAQTHHDWEAIIVDDGSTDETATVVRQFHDSRIGYVFQKNQGQASARNRGILAARGETIGFLDADDVWLPNYLATMLPILKADMGTAAVYSGWYYMDAVGNSLPAVAVKKVTPERLFDTIACMNFLNICGVLVRSACFARLGLFDESLNLQGCEDWDMWLRTAQAYRMVGVPLPLVVYRMHGASMTTELARFETARRMVVSKHFGADEGDPSNWSIVKCRAYGGLYLVLGQACLQNGTSAEGQRYLQRAFETCPHFCNQLSAFYEIGVAHQSPGTRGVFERLNWDRSRQDILECLHAITAGPGVSQSLQARRVEACGNAYLALGLLAYGCGRMAEARRYLFQAIRFHPVLILRSPAAFDIAKSFLGGRFLKTLRRIRLALMGTN